MNPPTKPKLKKFIDQHSKFMVTIQLCRWKFIDADGMAQISELDTDQWREYCYNVCGIEWHDADSVIEPNRDFIVGFDPAADEIVNGTLFFKLDKDGNIESNEVNRNEHGN